MCRMAAFPPGTTKREAFEVLKEFASYNKDGTGVCYVKDGRFVLHKWALPLVQVLARRLPLVDHMPCKSWTIIHLRAASAGDVRQENSHPFIAKNWALCHNGTWMGCKPVRILLEKMGHMFAGNTDSEVGAALWAEVGAKRFMKAVDNGVWFALNLKGHLWAYCGSGDLKFRRDKKNGKYLLASDLEGSCTEVDEGWIHLGSKGTLIKSDYEKDPVTVGVYRYRSSSRSYGPPRSGYYGGYGGYGGYAEESYPLASRVCPEYSGRGRGVHVGGSEDDSRGAGLWDDDVDEVISIDDDPPLPAEYWSELSEAEKKQILKDVGMIDEAGRRKKK